MSEDEQRIERASRGDVTAIDELMARYLPRLSAFVRLRMGPQLRAKESAADLVQSACREILGNLDRYRYRGEEQFRHWLFATALRKLQNRVDYYRAQKRDMGREVAPAQVSQIDSIADVYRDVATPSAALMAREQVERLEAAFDRLSDDHREVITLARICGLPHKEIAAAMGRSEIACRQLLARALATLAVLLGEDR